MKKSMHFQKIYILSTKFLDLFMGGILLFFNAIIIYSWAFGPNKMAQWLLKDQDLPMGWAALFFGFLSFKLIKDFFYYRKKMMAGFNDEGLCLWNERTNAYILIDWQDVEDAGVSFGFGGQIHYYPQGLVVVDFKKARWCKVDKNSGYKKDDDSCTVTVLDEEEIDEGSCAVNFGYWSWKPYLIKKEIKTRCHNITH